MLLLALSVKQMVFRVLFSSDSLVIVFAFKVLEINDRIQLNFAVIPEVITSFFTDRKKQSLP